MATLNKVILSDYIAQMGTGQPIPREEAIVYDFMPVILGDQFRTDDVLSRMLLRPAPEEAPFILTTNAYETLGLSYVSERKIVPALECYRIALNSRTQFTAAIASLQGQALLNPNEIQHLHISTDLENRLIEEAGKLDGTPDQNLYGAWVENLRVAKKSWFELNHQKYGSPEYIEACLKIGAYREALYTAEHLNDKTLIQKARRARPKEILDVKFLRKYIHDHFPESTMGRRREF